MHVHKIYILRHRQSGRLSVSCEVRSYFKTIISALNFNDFYSNTFIYNIYTWNIRQKIKVTKKMNTRGRKKIAQQHITLNFKVSHPIYRIRKVPSNILYF